jgi:tRNA threonylcarbamoyladenosine biosynthesis protein TsaB
VASITGNLDNPLILAIETSGRLGSVALAQGDKLLSEKQFSGPMRHSAEIFPAVTDLLSRFDKKPDQIEHVYISVGPGSFTGLRIAVTLAKTLALANDAKIIAVDTLDCIAANVTATENTDIFSHREHRGHRENNNDCRAGLAPPSPLPQLKTQHSTLNTDDRLAVILDAKRGQFFIAIYEQSEQPPVSFPRKRESTDNYPLYATRYTLNKILPDCLMTAEAFLARFSDKPIALIGEGLVFYKDKFAHKNIHVLDEKLWNPSAVNIHRLGWHKAQLGEFADPLTLTPNYIRGPDVTIKRI